MPTPESWGISLVSTTTALAGLRVSQVEQPPVARTAGHQKIKRSRQSVQESILLRVVRPHYAKRRQPGAMGVPGCIAPPFAKPTSNWHSFLQTKNGKDRMADVDSHMKLPGYGKHATDPEERFRRVECCLASTGFRSQGAHLSGGLLDSRSPAVLRNAAQNSRAAVRLVILDCVAFYCALIAL